MKRGPWIAQKIVKVLVIAAIAILLFGFIVMSLWNAILPGVLHVGTISFAQALGILVLCKILFGGFHGGWRGRGPGGPGGRWGQGMKEKWMNMSEEDREKFKQEWGRRCAKWGRPASATGSTPDVGNANAHL